MVNVKGDGTSFDGKVGSILGGILKLDAIAPACTTPAATLAVRCVFRGVGDFVFAAQVVLLFVCCAASASAETVAVGTSDGGIVVLNGSSLHRIHQLPVSQSHCCLLS